jgi:hypothetical protein
VLAATAAFGAAAGLFAGDGATLRSGVGNLSAPWLLVALLPAVRCRTAARGALLGCATTVAALAGFYAARTVLLAGQNGGGGFLREVFVEAGANRLYFVVAMLTGTLFGALGAWTGRRHPGHVGLLAGALLACEIAVVAAVQGHQLLPAPLYFNWAVSSWGPYIGECAVGAAIMAAALWRTRWRGLRPRR